MHGIPNVSSAFWDLQKYTNIHVYIAFVCMIVMIYVQTYQLHT